MRFGNILVAASTVVLALAAPSVHIKKRASKFQWFGVNESGAEFGSGSIPGELGKDYIWPVEYAPPSPHASNWKLLTQIGQLLNRHSRQQRSQHLS